MFNVQLVLEQIFIQNAAVDVSFTIEVVFFFYGDMTHIQAQKYSPICWVL